MKLVIAADIPQCHQIQHRFSLNFPPHKDATEFVSRRVVKEPEFTQFFIAISFLQQTQVLVVDGRDVGR